VEFEIDVYEFRVGCLSLATHKRDHAVKHIAELTNLSVARDLDGVSQREQLQRLAQTVDLFRILQRQLRD
jgi:hypothetical protein